YPSCLRLRYFTLLSYFTLTPPTAISPLSLHDALPIWADPPPQLDELGQGRHSRTPQHPPPWPPPLPRRPAVALPRQRVPHLIRQDRKSTRLNSSHVSISYAVFCLKKKIHLAPVCPLLH